MLVASFSRRDLCIEGSDGVLLIPDLDEESGGTGPAAAQPQGQALIRGLPSESLCLCDTLVDECSLEELSLALCIDD